MTHTILMPKTVLFHPTHEPSFVIRTVENETLHLYTLTLPGIEPGLLAQKARTLPTELTMPFHRYTHIRLKCNEPTE